MKTKHLFLGLILPLALLMLGSGSNNYNKLGYVQSGKASYYADKFHGRQTASGERFNMYAMTCAHKKIQFGSLVEVTNLNNGKKLIVRVNDRGPFVAGRIVDLSKGAAKKLDMIRDGVVNVKLELIRVGKDGEVLAGKGKEDTVSEEKEKKDPKVTHKPKTKRPSKTKKKYVTRTYNLWGVRKKVYGYGVQVGSYSGLSSAAKMGTKVFRKGFKKVFIQVSWNKQGQRIFKVFVGDGTRTQAQSTKRRLQSKDINGFVKGHHINK